MNYRAAIATMLFATVVASCTPANELVRATYAGNGRVQTGLGLIVDVQSVDASANDVRGAPLIVGSSPLDNIRFNRADQQTMAASLESELLRLHVFSPPANDNAGNMAKLTLKYNITNYLPQPFPEYRISFTIKLLAPNMAPFEKDYAINSLDGLSTSQKWNINAPRSKLKAEEQALAKVIPDLEAYLSQPGN